ncbi:MAG: aminotransferase class IV family protein, partial [Pararhizobium sp.]
MTDFSLIETMRWEPGTGIVRLRLHLARLKRSAGRLGFAGAEQAEQRLAEAIAEVLPPSVPARHLPLKGGDQAAATSHRQRTHVGEMPDRAEGGNATNTAANRSPSPLRVRLTLSPSGDIAVTTAPFTPLPEDSVWRVAIAATRLDSADKLLRHKTTRRAVYEAARNEYPATDADEVLLLNEKGEPCEGTITSLFLDDGSGILKTPPISCGLLAGVLRTELICARRARVQRLSLADMKNGRLYIGNSLRGLIKT